VSAILSGTIVPGLEAYLVGRAYTNDNSASGDYFQVIGDTTLGAKLVRPIGRGFANVGISADVLLTNGPGKVGFSAASTSARLRAVSTFAFDALPRPLPFRLHLGIGYLLDNSSVVVRDEEDARSAALGSRQQITRIERFGSNVSKVDRLELAIGIDSIGASSVLRPFVEWSLGYPVNRQRYDCRNMAIDVGDACLRSGTTSTLSAAPSKLTLGMRTYPFGNESRSVSLLFAIDLGLTGTSSFVSELAPQAPYTVWMGFSIATRDRTVKVVTETVEVKRALPLVTLVGTVHPAGKKTPIADAIVTFVGASHAPLATDANGHFGADVAPGTYELRVRAKGYKDGTCGGTAVATEDTTANMPTWPPSPGAAVLTIDCALEEIPPDP